MFVWITLWLTCQCTAVKIHSDTPLTGIQMGKGLITGASLITPVNLQFINTLCNQTVSHLELTHRTLTKLMSNKLLEDISFNNDVGFLRRFSFLFTQIENTYTEIVKFLEQNLICFESYDKLIEDEYKLFKTSMNQIWTKLSEINANTDTFEVYHSFSEKRPIGLIHEKFVGTAIVGGIAVGSILGVAIANIFKSDNVKDIEMLNNRIHNSNKNILITNQRIDVLSKNLTTSIKNIKLILENINKVGETAESRFSVTWNAEQLKDAATNMLILFKICDNSLTLLRNGDISSDLLDLETFIKVVKEGEKFYTDMKFPISNLTKEVIPDIIKLLKVKHVGHNKYMLVIPLVRKEIYNIYSLIPHPLRIKKNKI